MTSSPSAAVDRPQTMKPAHIAGLAVAAVATFIIAIGLIVLSIFLRRRRERRRKSEAVNEKLGLPHSPTDDPNRLTQSVGRSESTLDLSARFPLPPVPALRRPGEGTSSTMARHPRPLSPPGQNDRPAVPPKNETNNTPANDLGAIHPVLRPTLNAANKSSDSSLTVNQIGLAISSEVPRQSTVMGNSIPPARRLSFRQQRQRSIRRISEASQRPDSDVTQYTVFEEDDTVDAPEQRRQSVLLPTPPIPIPPIRSFQPSRPPPRFPMQPPTQSQQPRQRSELFIDIPIRQSSTRPPRFIPQDPSQGATSTLRASLAPPIELLPPQKPMTTNTSTPETHHSGDIPDYYFTSHRYRTPKNSTPRIDNPPHRKPPAEKPHVKPKSSSSNVSRTTSRASTNIRDSFSSQTSFESADMDDPTPEDENNNKLSPVAESPISNLRYPKVPRTSNQLVPRSPRSPQSQKSQDSPRWLPGPSSLLIKRRGEEPARQIGSPLSGSPLPNEMRQQIRQYRQHLRSNSVETWSPIRDSERSTRTQSGMWPPKSPMMYEPDVVRPLSIRPKQNQKFLQTPRTEREVLKSPVWVPRLTPTRQGEDLFINVTYSKPGQ
ncbi:hypothetical protein CC80DRAFT_546827 [Byssothecium circinans]|uniref:Uncharacterized protein n=1 Tax=Byssothecium circinans TaxID=147558 RepID=A0A6A5TY21_9PLEO|nr:hypothetical protein CC80DRAFT_546827 [Byssothecium circinans]